MLLSFSASMSGIEEGLSAMVTPKDARALLLARRDELTALSSISQDARETVDLDQQSVGRLSRMDALQMQAMAKAQEQRRAIELTRIDMALSRLADTPDDYGFCDDCGEAIPDGRLALDPAATHCVRCA
ncbi:MAG: TraR/DksA C4-type zinc finger protein [Pseudomonadota bacterium]